jgi:hypothetical protein
MFVMVRIRWSQRRRKFNCGSNLRKCVNGNHINMIGSMSDLGDSNVWILLVDAYLSY